MIRSSLQILLLSLRFKYKFSICPRTKQKTQCWWCRNFKFEFDSHTHTPIIATKKTKNHNNRNRYEIIDCLLREITAAKVLCALGKLLVRCFEWNKKKRRHRILFPFHFFSSPSFAPRLFAHSFWTHLVNVNSCAIHHSVDLLFAVHCNGKQKKKWSWEANANKTATNKKIKVIKQILSLIRWFECCAAQWICRTFLMDTNKK